MENCLWREIWMSKPLSGCLGSTLCKPLLLLLPGLPFCILIWSVTLRGPIRQSHLTATHPDSQPRELMLHLLVCWYELRLSHIHFPLGPPVTSLTPTLSACQFPLSPRATASPSGFTGLQSKCDLRVTFLSCSKAPRGREESFPWGRIFKKKSHKCPMKDLE